MDVNGNGTLEAYEMGHFLARVCARFGIENPPNANQVGGVISGEMVQIPHAHPVWGYVEKSGCCLRYA